MDEGDARVQGLGGGMEGDGLAVQNDLALVGLQYAAQDVHQRGFARAVFAQQRADFSCLQAEIHLPQHVVGAEGFDDSLHGKVHGFTSSIFLPRASSRAVGISHGPTALCNSL